MVIQARETFLIRFVDLNTATPWNGAFVVGGAVSAAAFERRLNHVDGFEGSRLGWVVGVYHLDEGIGKAVDEFLIAGRVFELNVTVDADGELSDKQQQKNDGVLNEQTLTNIARRTNE